MGVGVKQPDADDTEYVLSSLSVEKKKVKNTDEKNVENTREIIATQSCRM
jgi:hypothetical protein